MKNLKKTIFITLLTIVLFANNFQDNKLLINANDKIIDSVIKLDKIVNPNDFTLNEKDFEILEIKIDNQIVNNISINSFPEGEHTITIFYRKYNDENKAVYQEKQTFYISDIHQKLTLNNHDLSIGLKTVYLDETDLLHTIGMIDEDGKITVLYEGDFTGVYKLKNSIDIDSKKINVFSKIYDRNNSTYFSEEFVTLNEKTDHQNDNTNDLTEKIRKDELSNTFNEKDWDIDSSEMNTLILKKLVNDNLKNIYIPGEYDGNHIKLSSEVFDSIRNKDSLIIKEVNGNKVGLESDSLRNAFSESHMIHLDLNGLDTSNVIDMYGTFAFSVWIKSLNVSEWNTSNVTNMKKIFYVLPALTELDVSKWDTSNVTDMSEAFESNNKLKSLDLSKWDTSKVKDMSSMFNGSSALETLDISNWDTSNVTNMNYLFYFAESLKDLDVSNWDTSSVTSMISLFSRTYKLPFIDVSRWDTSNVVDASYMFSHSLLIESIDLSGWNVEKMIKIDKMFYGTKSLLEIDISQWKLENVRSMNKIFYNYERSDGELYPLILIANDSHFLEKNYDYVEDNRRSFQNGTVKDASADGVFSDGKQYQYFNNDKIVFESKDNVSIDANTYNQFMNDEPTKPDSVFKHWINQDGIIFEEKNENTPLQETNIYYAVFVKDKYTVTYNVDGVSSSEIVLYGNYLMHVPEAKKEGYRFVKWIDQNNNKFDTNNSIDQDLVLTAVFVEEDNSMVGPEKPNQPGAEIQQKPENSTNDDNHENEKNNTMNNGDIEIINTGLHNTLNRYLFTGVFSLFIFMILRKKVKK